MFKWRVLVMIVLILSLGLVGCGKTEDDAVMNSAAVLETVQVESTKNVMIASPVEEVISDQYTSFGEIVAESQLDFYLSGSGEIESVFVSPGDVVSAGDSLAKLSSVEALASYNATESQLRTIRDNLKTQVTSLEDDYDKQLKLYEAGYIPESTLESIGTQLETLKRQLTDAETNYANQLKRLKKGLNDRVLSSTIDGVVAAVYIHRGEKLSGQKAVTILDRTNLYVEAMVTSDLLRKLEIGTEATIKVAGIKEPLNGEVAQIDSVPTEQTQLFSVKVLINGEHENDLYVGDYAEITFLSTQRQAILIPNRAIIYENEGAYVYVLSEDTAVKLPVEMGTYSDELVEITSDSMMLNLKVIVSGQENLEEGDRVFVKN